MWGRKTEIKEPRKMTLIEHIQEDTKELDKLQGVMCVNYCKFGDIVRSAYPETNSKCDLCPLNRYVARKMEEAGLLVVVKHD